MISIHPEGTFERLRYILGGDRPSQTAQLTLSSYQMFMWLQVRTSKLSEWYPNVRSTQAEARASKRPTYPVQTIPKFNINLQ